ncbi:hypothetical protein K437DRAFT_25015 [Tilletiaria anomala UBC 951]|uniref:WW domain-containing protein n=1 Tax=Tilletiaria anomala (strain ATCC 24038 / CBS 436.72 / UBC 951) TaxID=1037660 RepID=A0A066WE53_TILAU|nr:uncharacterized protein K437DRAFT_25015 [Tilletiaria anomala UBC 951]KDN52237.1 hypothetical protein K437DRAFT_25015 [Tilletiaria anomala UBC 951]
MASREAAASKGKGKAPFQDGEASTSGDEHDRIGPNHGSKWGPNRSREDSAQSPPAAGDTGVDDPDAEDEGPPPLPDEPPPLPHENTSEAQDEGPPPLPDEPPSLPREDEDEAPPLPEEEEPPSESPGDGRQPQGHPWQAVWDPSRGAYYFWNSATNETTWINPLTSSSSAQPTADGQQLHEPGAQADASASSNAAPSQGEIFEQLTGIDSDLAFLDPSLSSSLSAGAVSAGGSYRTVGHFDARKGKFVPQAQATLGAGGQYDPTRMTHASQANRQMEAFFDTKAWQEDLEKRRREEEEEREGKKRLTKKDLARFRERKKEKKAAKYGWLRY